MLTGRGAAIESKYSLNQPADELREDELLTPKTHQASDEALELTQRPRVHFIAPIEHETLSVEEFATVEGKHAESNETARRSRAISYTLFHQALNEIELLKYVMNANPAEAKKLLDQARSVSDCLPLMKTHGTERCGRKWSSISPLEMAAWAGDTDMVRLLLSYIPPQFYRDAVIQLVDVYMRPETAENGVYLAPYKVLLNAYDTFDKQYKELLRFNRLYDIDTLWVDGIGKAQRMLPMVGLQELCDPKPFAPTPDFKQPPRREYQLSDGEVLDPATLGTKFAIHHGGAGKNREVRSRQTNRDSLKEHLLFIDHDAMRRLCSVRRLELQGIIKDLRNTLPKKVEPMQEVEVSRPCCSIL